MGFLSNFIGSSAAEPIEAIGNVLDKLVTSDEERAAQKIIMTKLGQQPQIAAQEIGKVQAQHRSIFVAGGRPFIIWVCGFGLGYAWVVRPIITDIATFLGKNMTWATMSTENMIDLVVAILGLGALRTVEKLRGRTK